MDSRRDRKELTAINQLSRSRISICLGFCSYICHTPRNGRRNCFTRGCSQTRVISRCGLSISFPLHTSSTRPDWEPGPVQSGRASRKRDPTKPRNGKRTTSRNTRPYSARRCFRSSRAFPHNLYKSTILGA